MIGRFIVYEYPQGVGDPHDIAFQLRDDVAGSIPRPQADLKSEIEKTLIVLRTLFPPDDHRFKRYFAELLALSRYGLIGEAAEPAQAGETLQNLQNQIFDNEKGQVISGYMAAIIKSEIVLIGGGAAVLLIGGAIIRYVFEIDGMIVVSHLAMALVGLFIGLVFSSFIRCRTVGFHDLHAIDADRFTPALKAAFALITLILAGAFLKAGLFEIKIGTAQLSTFDRDWIAAFMLGAATGIAQEALISRIESIGRQITNGRKTTVGSQRRRRH